MTTDRAPALKAHFGNANQNLRPIFTSLNGDSSWLLSFPRPLAERKVTGKAYYHIVHDPWLNGPMSQWSTWLIYISLSSAPTVTNGAGVESIVREIERAAVNAGILPSEPETSGAASPIDAILIHFHYGDHLHKPTLLTFSPTIPVFATKEAATIMKGWKHFDAITETKDLDPTSFSGDWTSLHPGGSFPKWLTKFRVQGDHELNFASAMMWTSAPGVHEAILYSPHGMHVSKPALQTLLHKSAPKFKVLALLHGLKESWTLNMQTTFGVATGLALQREADAKYWVNTHNDVLKYGGLLWLLTTDTFRTLEWGLGLENEKGVENGSGERKNVEVVDVKNGGCVVLD